MPTTSNNQAEIDRTIKLASDITGIEERHLTGDTLGDTIELLYHYALQFKQAEEMQAIEDGAWLKTHVTKKFQSKFYNSPLSGVSLGERLAEYRDKHPALYRWYLNQLRSRQD